MAETTLPTEVPRGYTFEDVWASLMEGRKQQQETARQMKETDRRMEETAQQMKETDRRMEKTDREMEKTERMIKRLGKQMGGLHRSFGRLTEHLVVPGIMKRFNEIGYHFETGIDGNVQIFDEQGNVRTEADIILENRESILVVEVKSKPVMRDVKHHIRRMEIMREHYERRHDNRKLYGALAGAVFGQEEKEATLEAGMFVLEPSGDTIKMSIPEGFVPREW